MTPKEKRTRDGKRLQLVMIMVMSAPIVVLAIHVTIQLILLPFGYHYVH